MRYLIFIVFALGILNKTATQNLPKEIINKSPAELKTETINFLLDELKNAGNDETRLRILDSLSIYYLYFSTQTDSALIISNTSIDIAFPLKDKKHLILAYARKANYFWQKTNLKAALENSFKGIQLSKELHIPNFLSTHYNNMINIYMQYYNKEQLIKNTTFHREYLQFNTDPFFDQNLASLLYTGNAYQIDEKYDSAIIYFTRAYEASVNSKDQINSDIALWFLGSINHTLKKYELADSIYINGIEQCKKNFDNQILNAIYGETSSNYIALKQFRKAIVSAHIMLNNARLIKDPFATLLSVRILSNCYDSLGIRDSTLFFLKLANMMNDSLFNANNVSSMQEVVFSDQIRQKELQANAILEKEKNRNKLRLYGFLTGTSIFLLVGLLIWRNSLQRKKANRLLQKQKEELQTMLQDLKKTQAQLIQSEKMASLGELTSGIAHEIQNPLNFVNNFSEVNTELIAEMRQEAEQGNIEEVKNIAWDIEENERKINYHGKRADSIVKGMLLHSRSSTGQKEPTDINVLADEYLRLAYHGFRAKENSFNVILNTRFDETIGTINIIPQDIGRVILNLITNAFHAVTEKKKQLPDGYEPAVTVTTKKIGDSIHLLVKDNGNGIPLKILDKIFQPFFTTKPTGEGTGLGLSLSYDTVKAHGGELTVRSQPGEGAEFTITLSYT